MCYNASDLPVTQNTLEDITVSKEQNNSVHSFIHTKWNCFNDLAI